MASTAITLAISGASGVPYSLRLLQQLIAADRQVYLLVSKAGRMVIADETDFQLPKLNESDAYFQQEFSASPGQVKLFGLEDWHAPVASGTGISERMVVCPCSMGMLSSIACGASNNLIERAADVTLKERKQLVLVPRESPYSEIHLEHMLKLTRMGAVMVDANPGFYYRPNSVESIVDFVVARILDQLQIDHQILPSWGS